ncbi:MAG: hypothetical protein KG029_05430 [Bacteroidetes bacterium]|nr:hypothetical protein [Bacteroidota bacterium]
MVKPLNESYYDELMLSQHQPSRIRHADGYKSLGKNGEDTFYYTLSDHLGNVRIVMQAGGSSGNLKQTNDYYPFGMAFTKNAADSEEESWSVNAGGLMSIQSSGYEYSQSQTLEDKVEHGFGTFIGGVRLFGGPIGAGISIYWGTVGKPLHNNWRKDVLTPQIQMGIEGYPSVMPFK